MHKWHLPEATEFGIIDVCCSTIFFILASPFVFTLKAKNGHFKLCVYMSRTVTDNFSMKEATFDLKLAKCMQKSYGSLNPWLHKNRSYVLICDFYWWLSHICHVDDLSQPFYQHYLHERVLLQRFTWCLLLYEHWAFYNWLCVSDSYSDRPPTYQRLIWDATRATAANQAECKKITLYSSLSLDIDYESLTAEHTLLLCRLRCQISSTLLGSLC